MASPPMGEAIIMPGLEPTYGSPSTGRSTKPLREGRGQAVGLYSRFIWRGITALPICQHRGYLRVAILSVARS
jgi:hypothetical protein